MEKIVRIGTNDEPILFQGYIWWSDKENPDIFLNKAFELGDDELKKHFIVEGQLLGGGHSYSIKYIDGKYWVYKYNIGSQGTNLTFLPHRMACKEIKGLKFKQYWKAVEDPYCEGMPVLRPAEFVFMGFKMED